MVTIFVKHTLQHSLNKFSYLPNLEMDRTRYLRSSHFLINLTHLNNFEFDSVVIFLNIFFLSVDSNLTMKMLLVWTAFPYHRLFFFKWIFEDYKGIFIYSIELKFCVYNRCVPFRLYIYEYFCGRSFCKLYFEAFLFWIIIFIILFLIIIIPISNNNNNSNLIKKFVIKISSVTFLTHR